MCIQFDVTERTSSERIHYLTTAVILMIENTPLSYGLVSNNIFKQVKSKSTLYLEIQPKRSREFVSDGFYDWSDYVDP